VHEAFFFLLFHGRDRLSVKTGDLGLGISRPSALGLAQGIGLALGCRIRVRIRVSVRVWVSLGLWCRVRVRVPGTNR